MFLATSLPVSEKPENAPISILTNDVEIRQERRREQYLNTSNCTFLVPLLSPTWLEAGLKVLRHEVPSVDTKYVPVYTSRDSFCQPSRPHMYMHAHTCTYSSTAVQLYTGIYTQLCSFTASILVIALVPV
jgi:hypothetical protein